MRSIEDWYEWELSERPKGIWEQHVPLLLFQPKYYMGSPEIEPGLSRWEIDGGQIIYIEFVVEEIYYLSKLILMGTMSKQL